MDFSKIYTSDFFCALTIFEAELVMYIFEFSFRTELRHVGTWIREAREIGIVFG